MGTLSDRLKQLSAEMDRGWQARLAERCGVKAPSVADWLSGKSKSLEGKNLLKAAEFFKVHPEWLASGRGPKLLNNKVATEPAASYYGDATDLTIPQYDAGGSMGRGLLLEDKPPGLIKAWQVDEEWLRMNVRHHTGIKNLCIVTGFGPSMRGMFNPGDPLLCDRGVTSVETDAVYFFRIDSHGFIKILQRLPTENGMVLRAKSKNPDYEPFDITRKVVESEGFEVFGKILTVWKSEQV